MEQEVYRSAFGRGLTIALAVICVGSLVLVAVEDGLRDVVGVAPWLGLVVVLCWACFWRPAVGVDDAGVTLVNVSRRVTVPWPALTDVDTQWALRLTTVYGRFSAWAAPAPGMKTAVTSRRLGDVDDARVVGSPITPWRREGGTAVRPGDLPQTSSGEAAAMVRRRWTHLREAGHLDDPRLEHERPTIHWHLDTLAIVVALLVLGVVTAITGW